MSNKFSEFGDLVLLIGDFYVPQRAIDMPLCFRELLNTDQIRHVLCTGNIGCKQILDRLYNISSSVHIVRGEIDINFDFPEYKIVQIGQYRVGLIHGHQIIPWGDEAALLQWQRRLDCDILVSGHTNRHRVCEVGGKIFINPGSATGAYNSNVGTTTPSFMLMAIQNHSIVLYLYEEILGKANVVMTELKKNSNI